MGEKTPESALTGIATVGAFGTTFVDEIEDDIGFSDIGEFIGRSTPPSLPPSSSTSSPRAPSTPS